MSFMSLEIVVFAPRSCNIRNFMGKSDMDAIHFETEVCSDNTIRIPEGISLPPGPLRVTIVSRDPSAESSDELSSTRSWLLSLAAEAENDPTPLPADLAANHDYYAHGKPRE
jgi:hypothetical protein